MKISLGILVLCAASVCIYGTNLRMVQLHEKGQHTRSALIDMDSFKNDARIGTKLTKSDLVCPKRPPTSPDAPIRERALCPWQINTTYDETRRPHFVEEAVCLCKRCFNQGTCYPIFAPINVYKILSADHWEVQTLSRAVACECRQNLL